MAHNGVGIDLGTSSIIASWSNKINFVSQPAIVAVNKKTKEVLKVGQEVYDMLGKAPAYIDVVRPLKDGVISDFNLTGVLIKHMLGKVGGSRLFKPQVIICVPSAITGVESQSVVNATVKAGARQVFLIEEPVAAAIGAGIDISKPFGNMVVDIGGGTADAAVLSLNGIVCKQSIKAAGNTFDDAVTKYVRSRYGLIIGEKMAEKIKISIGSLASDGENPVFEAKGRDVVTGLPQMKEITRAELRECLLDTAEMITAAIHRTLEKTPPELAGDIRSSGIYLTGGGALLDGLDKFIEEHIRIEVRIPENPLQCVAKGTIMSFKYMDDLADGFLHTVSHKH